MKRIQMFVIDQSSGKMFPISITIYTSFTILLPNETSNGFNLITISSGGDRTYRITRERRSPMAPITPNSSLDCFDFEMNLSRQTQGSLVILGIPYIDSLFTPYTTTSPTIYDLFNLGSSLPPASLFSGEIFKLLYISVNSDDPVRETPSYVNLQAIYTISGLPRGIQFIYYTIIKGQPIYTGYFGNVAFTGQYNSSITIDPTKIVNIVTDPTGTIDYYIIRIDSTPNVIITNGISQTAGLSDTYTLNGITYTLTATAGGISRKGNGFYATLNVPSGLDPSISTYGFSVQPASAISDYTVSQLSDTSYRFLIEPAVGVLSMDLKITFVGPPY